MSANEILEACGHTSAPCAIYAKRLGELEQLNGGLHGDHSVPPCGAPRKIETPFRKLRKGAIADESIRFRLLDTDTHVVFARKGDTTLQGDDAESRSCHKDSDIVPG